MINVKFYGILNKTLGRRKYASEQELMIFLSAAIYETNVSYDEKRDVYHVAPKIAGHTSGGKGSPPPVPLLKPPSAGNNILQSFSQMEVVDLICEGPIQGFCDSDGNEIALKTDKDATIAQGVFLNNTIVQNQNNTFNFRRLSLNSSVGDAAGLTNMAWARSKVYRTVDIGRGLIGPNMKTHSTSAVDGGLTPKYNMEGQSGANYRNNYGNAIGWYLGDSQSTELAKKYGYTHSSLQYGSDVRTNTETRNFTSWSPGQANYNEGAFPVTHTVSNSEVDYAYTTISVDGLSDTVDHGSGPGKSGLISSVREYRVGFEIQIGINGLTNQEAQSPSFKAWLSRHGVTQSSDSNKARLSVTRNYYIEGIVQGGSYLIDVGRAPWGTEFGNFATDYQLKDISEAEDRDSVESAPDAGRVDDVSGGKLADPTQFDTDADYTGGHGLNKYRQFGYKNKNDSGVRGSFEDALQTAYIDPDDGQASSQGASNQASSFDCFQLPPCDESTNFKTRYIKVTKLGREVISPLLSNNISFKSVTEIIDERLSLPFSAVMQQSFNSRYFNGIPSRTYHLKLKKILIPKNYFPEKRLPSAPRNSPDDKTYNGDWDGTFKEAWSDNPAWIFYDLLINNRYGLGSHVDVHKIDKWTLYKIGRYCDAVDEEGYFIGVDDTYSQNEKEPRYTCNVMITNEEESYELLKSISEIFHGIAFWDGRGVSVSMDGGSSSVSYQVWSQNKNYSVGTVVESPQNSFNFFKCRVAASSINKKPGIDNNWQEHWERTPGIETEPPSMAFSNTNVDGGVFTYSNASKASRFTVARVSYMDKRDDFRKKYEYVEDKQGIKELGIIKKNLEPLGCTSRGQAHRMGRWFFLTSTLNTEVISFATDYRALFLQPGNIITVNDRLKNQQQKIGKILGIHESDDTILRLTEEVDIKTLLTDGQEGANFEIILTSLDPNYSIEYINDSSNFSGGGRTLEDIDKLNNSQIVRGIVERAPDLGDQFIKIRSLEDASFFQFTNKLSNNASGKKVIPPGTDWALVKPEDGDSHQQDWYAREYKIQGISEEEEGKYVITAIYFDKEKIGSMDQKFPVITPKIDMDGGFSKSKNYDLPGPDLTSVVLDSQNQLDKVKIKVEGSHPPSDGFNQSTMSTEVCFYSPDGIKRHTELINRGSSSAFSCSFESSLTLSEPASEGVWYVEAITKATNSTTQREQVSTTSSMGVSVGNFQFRAGAVPVISNLKVNGAAHSSVKVKEENDTFSLSWQIIDIDEDSTVISDRSAFNTSPFMSGVKVGLVALDDSSNAEVGDVMWIHGLISQGAQKSLLKGVSYSFQYNERYRTVSSADGEIYAYPSIANSRNIRIKVVAEAKAGVESNGEPKYVTGSQKHIDIINKTVVFEPESTGGSMEFLFDQPFDAATYMNGTSTSPSRPSNWKKISYSYENADGETIKAQTDFNKPIPESVSVGDDEFPTSFDARTELLTSDAINRISGIDSAGRVLTGSAAVAVWRMVKNGTKRSLSISNSNTPRPVSHLANKLGIGLLPITRLREIAEKEEPPTSDGGVHFYNYRLVVAQIDEGVADGEVVEELGGWKTDLIDIVENRQSFLDLYNSAFDEKAKNKLLVMDSLTIGVFGTDDEGDIQNNVGHMTAHLCKTSSEPATTSNQVASSNSPSVTINFDEEGVAGLSNDPEEGRFIKIKIWDTFSWNARIGESDDERKTALTSIQKDILAGDMFFMDQSSNYTDISADDDSADFREAKLGVNTFGDERIAGYKQFYDGMVIGGTHAGVGWPDGKDLEYEHVDAFTQYPIFRGNANDGYAPARRGASSFRGSPVGIGQFNIKNLVGIDFTGLMGDGNDKDAEGMTLSEDISDLRDYHVAIKGLNLTCEAGDAGNYNGSGGLISGQKVHAPGMRAGTQVDFNTLPTIESSSFASKITGESEVSTFVSDRIDEKALPLGALADTSFTESLKISGGANIGMSGDNLIIKTQSAIYKITGQVI